MIWFWNDQKYKLLASANAEMLKGNPKYLGASLAQGHAHFLPSVPYYEGA